MTPESEDNNRPEDEIYPSSIQKAYGYHEDYLDALDSWQTFRDEYGQKIALWSNIFWVFQNAKHADDERGLDVNLDEMREGLDVPGDRTWEESVFEMLGLDTDTEMSAIISGETELKAQQGSSGDEDIDLGQFIEYGRRMYRKKRSVEYWAQMLHEQMFSRGGSVDSRSTFQQDFGTQDYERQINITKKLTQHLGKSQIGREILAKLMNPQIPQSGKVQHFRAYYLFYPPTVWKGYVTDALVNPPPKADVSQGDSEHLALDGDGNPYVRDLKLANVLTVLAGQLMPGVTFHQAKEHGDLGGANDQLSMLAYMIDGGLDNPSWKQFREGSGADDAQTFKHLADALTTSEEIIDKYRSSSWSRYQVNDMESAGRQAKLRQYQLCSANFAGLFSLMGATWGAVAKANENQLDFNIQGVYSSLGNFHDAANLYEDWRKLAGMEYDSVGLKNGKFVKYSSSADSATTWGKTLLDWAGHALDVADAFVSAYTSATAAASQEYDVAVLAGLGAVIAIASLAVGGWLGALFAVAGIVVGYLTNWVTDDAITKWARRTIFGDTDISEETNNDPSSRWFGFEGYKRVSAPTESKVVDGMNRQITEFYNLIMPFSVGDPITIKEQSDGTYSCSFTVSDIAMGGAGSSFLLQPIYVKSGTGEYQVGDVSYDVIPITQYEQGGQIAYGGVDETIEGIELTTTPTFKGSGSEVNESSKRMTDVTLSFSGAEKVSDLFGLTPFKIDGAKPSYLEVIHVPRNFKSAVRTELAQALGQSPPEKLVDTVVDQQPYPRQRSEMEAQYQ